MQQAQPQDDRADADSQTLAPYPAYPLPTRSIHRAPAVMLPDDPAEACAEALALIRGSDSYDRSAALEALRERVQQLTSSDGDAVIAELGRQMAVMSELATRYAVESVTAKGVEARSRFAKIAM